MRKLFHRQNAFRTADCRTVQSPSAQALLASRKHTEFPEVSSLDKVQRPLRRRILQRHNPFSATVCSVAQLPSSQAFRASMQPEAILR